MKIEITALNYCHRGYFTGGGRIKPVTHYGCYYCARVYKLAEHPIQEWVDGGQTALCPTCGIDAVIPQAHGVELTQAGLEKLCKEMFS